MASPVPMNPIKDPDAPTSPPRRWHRPDGLLPPVCPVRAIGNGARTAWMIVSAAPAEERNCEYVSKASDREQPVVRTSGVAAGNLGQPGRYEGEDQDQASYRRRPQVDLGETFV